MEISEMLDEIFEHTDLMLSGHTHYGQIFPFNFFVKLKYKNIYGLYEKIKSKLLSDVDLVQKMSDYHLNTGGKRLRALLTLGSSKLCGYEKGTRDVNLAACVELIHAATLMHDDVIDNGDLRRGKKTLNKIWGNQSSILVGDYLLSRCFEMMVEDGDQEVLKLLSSTSAEISQGEVLQLQHNREIDMLLSLIHI